MRQSPLSLPRPALLAPLALLSLALGLAACGGGDDGATEPSPTGLSLTTLSSFQHAGGTSAAEITAFDAASKRLFVVNGALGSVDVLNLADPAAPVLVGTITLGAGEAVNSVAVKHGIVALAVQAAAKTDPGRVVFFAANAAFGATTAPAPLASVTVGALPDMLTFSPDGRTVWVANEGEPNSYGLADSVDPEGSISLIDVSTLRADSVNPTLTVRTADFRAFNDQIATLRSQGVRLYGPGATVAQDLEPEYITVDADSSRAWVTLQENNAIALVDAATAKVVGIFPLGTKDFNVAGAGLDASDEDGGTNTNSGTPAVSIVPRPVKGMYLPDAIASYQVNGLTYLITANEGDARADWPGFNEETRVRTHCAAGLDPTVFPDATNLLFDSNLGRLRITTTPNGDRSGKNAAGQCTELYAFGGRSFSIWTSSGQRVWDSGDQFEQRTKALANVPFNASHDNATLDSRSASKGPEPEGVVVGRFGSRTFAFIGLERVGGVMVYDVTVPSAPTFLSYANPRQGATGDRGPEGLTLIPADQAPGGKPLLVIGHEVSGTTTVMRIDLQY
jgi:hypothetical protein